MYIVYGKLPAMYASATHTQESQQATINILLSKLAL